MTVRGQPTTRSLLALLLAFAAMVHCRWALAEDPPAEPDVEAFERAGCAHCEAAHEWLEDLRRRRPDLDIVERDVSADDAALEDLRREADRAGVGAVSFPTFRVRGRLIVGFDSRETTGEAIEALLTGGEVDVAGGETCGLEPTCEERAPDRVDLPLLGSVDPAAFGLPLFTIAIGLIDGFNPCAMWVLLFLLAMLVNLRDRARILLIAGTFVVVSGAAYYAFMAAWLSVFMFVGLSRGVQIGLGVLALVVGGVHVKDFVAPRKGPSLSIPESVKPTIYARVRGVMAAKTVPLALALAAVLALLVNVVEVLCTAGLPAVYTQVLAAQGVAPAARYAYLALYAVAYMFDDALMVGIAVVTLGKHKLQERGGRVLKLLSGATLVVLGALLLFAPGALVW